MKNDTDYLNMTPRILTEPINEFINVPYRLKGMIPVKQLGFGPAHQPSPRIEFKQQSGW